MSILFIKYVNLGDGFGRPTAERSVHIMTFIALHFISIWARIIRLLCIMQREDPFIKTKTSGDEQHHSFRPENTKWQTIPKHVYQSTLTVINPKDPTTYGTMTFKTKLFLVASCCVFFLNPICGPFWFGRLELCTSTSHLKKLKT